MNAPHDLRHLEAGSVEMATAFAARAAARDLTIGIIGLGYVGLPLAEAFLKAGFRVFGYDVDESKISAIKASRGYIKHIPDHRLRDMNATGRLTVSADPAALGGPDCLLLCVPTPLNQHREPDISFVESTCRTIARTLRRGQLIVLESTTYPGTSEEVMRPILESSGLKAGVDFAIAYSPEREDPGNIDFDTTTIPKIVGADSDPERRMAVAVYETITEVVPVRDMKTAEAVKLTENIFRLVNIALINELKLVYGGMGIDVWEVINGAKTKPFGFMPFYPGPGLGGHCIPIDPFYLTWKARAHGQSTRFIELAGEVVSGMPRIVIEQLTEAMSTRLRKAVAGSRILVVGLAYKKNVDDMRESPSLHLIHMLRKRGAEVDYYDPHIPEVPHNRDHPEFAGLRSIAWTRESLAQYDAVLISTDHDDIDYQLLAETVPLIIDTRNAMRDFVETHTGKIVKA
ncbi:MAG: nucleotide sugar dehydrogenase [Parvularculaceae bacterium]|nr:nucleotide sugar dehydrogenase [Parvularculaceae bacterium]